MVLNELMRITVVAAFFRSLFPLHFDFHFSLSACGRGC
jgi:hypothetical protein